MQLDQQSNRMTSPHHCFDTHERKLRSTWRWRCRYGSRPLRSASRLGTSAFAQNIVTDCDKYAADGLDPQRKAAGVDFENMNVALAFPACEGAVLQYRTVRA